MERALERKKIVKIIVEKLTEEYYYITSHKSYLICSV